MKDESKCVRSGYTPKNGEPGTVPIVQSTTYVFDTASHIGELFDMPLEYMYSRFANPTVDAVEKKIADLENGVAAMCTSSGQAASLLTILNVCKSGESFVASSKIYGGTVNLFSVTLKRFGIECIYVDPDDSEEKLQSAIKSNTRLVFGETIANPSLAVLDIEKFARIAHRNKIPLVVDNTFATPIFCKPIDFGADIVVHSTTKYMDGHAVQVGGVIVDGGKFDWKNGNFSEFTQPDDSYHGIVYTDAFPACPFIAKARMQLMRDFGTYPAAHSAFLLNMGLETLHLRMPKYHENAVEIAKYLKTRTDKLTDVRCPALEDDPHYNLAKKYTNGKTCGVITFVINGGRKVALDFMNSLKFARNEVHVADIRTCVSHSASSTHRQLTDDQLFAAGVAPGLIRFSVGLEDVGDILDDIKQALEQI